MKSKHLINRNVLLLGTCSFLNELAQSTLLTVVTTERLEPNGKYAWFNRNYQERDFDGKSAVFSFINDSNVKELAKKRGILYYDGTDQSDFTVSKSVFGVDSKGLDTRNTISPKNIAGLFKSAAERMEVLEKSLSIISDQYHKFLSQVVQTWDLESIALLSQDQIEFLVLQYQNGNKATIEALGECKSLGSRTLSVDSLSAKSDDTANEKQTRSEIALNGIEAISQLAYSLSDMTFVYPEYTGQYSVLSEWYLEKKLNFNGVPTKIVNHIAKASGDSGQTLKGALANGSTVSVMMPSSAVPHFLPSLYSFVRDGLNPVFHVTANSFNEKLELEADYSQILKANHTGVPIFTSNSAEDAQYMGLIAHVISDKLKIPVIHFTDGVVVTNFKQKMETLDPALIKKVYNVVQATDERSFEIFEDIISRISLKIGKFIQAIEYHGSELPTTLFVSLNTYSASIKLAMEKLNSEKVGYLNIRMYRPWSVQKFLSMVPKSTCNVVIIDQSDGKFAKEIESAFYHSDWIHPIPKVKISKFAKGIENIHPASVYQFAQRALSNIFADRFELSQKHSLLFKDSNDFIFVERNLAGSGIQGFQDIVDGPLYAQYSKISLATQAEPAQITYLRTSESKINSEYFIDQSDAIFITNLEVSKYFNFANLIAAGGIVFVNTSLNKDELLGYWGEEIIFSLAEKKAILYVVDCDLIASNYTIFYGKKQDYLKELLLAVFYQLAFNKENRKRLMNVLFQRVAQNSKNVAFTLTEAINETIQRIENLGSIDFAQINQLNVTSLPKFPVATVPSKNSLSPSDVEEQLETAYQIQGGHNVALPALFPSTFKLTEKLRPDIDGAYKVKVTQNQRLTPIEYERNVFHMELDIKGTGLNYEIGDALGVYAPNNVDAVAKFLATYQLDGSQIVYIDRPTESGVISEIRNIQQLLIHNLDIFGKPGKSFYQFLAQKATDINEKQQLAEILLDLDAYMNAFTPHFADLLVKFKSAKVTAEELLKVLPPLKPRHYSIASSQKMHPDSVHLLIVLVDWISKDGSYRQGQATSHLVNSKIGDELIVTVKPSVMKLPKSHLSPIIMSGLGTGMAPFRAFIEERYYWKQRGHQIGPMLLYFGSRNRANEYLYGEELDAYMAQGLLNLRLAFSRDQPEKVYIQHKIKEDRDILHDLMVEKEGSFYLCGPTWPVPDVTESLLDSFRLSLDAKSAEEYLEKLKETERFVLEVY